MTVIRHANFGARGFSSRQVPTGPVELDRAHPLARNLLAYWVFGSGAGLNDLCGNVPTLVPQSGARALAAPQGSGWAQDANSAVLVAAAPAALNITLGSMFWTGRTFGPPGGNNMGYITVTPDNAGSSPFDCYTLGNTTGALSDKLAFFTNSLVYDISGSVSTGTGTTSLGCSFQASGTTIGYRNGAFAGSGTIGTIAGFSGTSQVSIGGYPAYSSGRYPNAHVSSAGIWARILTADEFAWLHAEPFALLRPVKRRLFCPAGVVTPPPTVRPFVRMVA